MPSWSRQGLFLSRSGSSTLPFAAVLGLVYNFLPFMILPIYTSVERPGQRRDRKRLMTSEPALCAPSHK